MSLTEFFFVRHGETDANLRGLMCGAGVDIELNETGKSQAAQAGAIIQAKAPPIETVCASPLKRAHTTAQLIVGQDRHIHLIEDLKEWHMGSWEHQPFELIKHEFLGDGEPLGGETRIQFKQRVQRGLQTCLQHSGPLLVVSHGGVGLALQDILSTPRFRIMNAVPHRIFRRHSGEWVIETL